MNGINPPAHVRAVLYLLAAVGAPVETWATAEGWLDGPTQVLIGAGIGLIATLAAGNATVTAVKAMKEQAR